MDGLKQADKVATYKIKATSTTTAILAGQFKELWRFKQI